MAFVPERLIIMATMGSVVRIIQWAMANAGDWDKRDQMYLALYLATITQYAKRAVDIMNDPTTKKHPHFYLGE